MTSFIIPLYILIIILFAYRSKIDAFESFIKGAKNGINIVIKIFPIYLSMIFATSLLNESNLIKDIFNLLYIKLDIPVEIFIQGFFRPISGSASLSVMIEIFQKYGVDSIESMTSSILQGSTDTTIYIITLYFGSVGIKKYSRAIKVGLLVDLIGFLVSILIIKMLF